MDAGETEREKERRPQAFTHSSGAITTSPFFLSFSSLEKHYYSASKLLAVYYLAKLSTQKDILANNTVVA